MKVYALNPPFVKGYIRTSRCTWLTISGSSWYPIHLGYMTGLLEKHGHEIKLVDAIVDGLTHNETIKDIERFNPGMTVIYVSAPSLDNDLNVAKRIKDATGCFVVLVGPWTSIKTEAEAMLKRAEYVDGIVRKEFDYPCLELADGVPEKEVKGLTWKNDGKIISNTDHPPVSSEQLDEFPFISEVYNRHLNIKNYRQAAFLHPFIDLFTARNCPYKCTFCNWPHTLYKDTGYRTRSIENVIEELKFVKEKMSFVREIFFQDDTLLQNRAKKISEAIIEEGLDITWSAYNRPNTDFETLKLMKKAGCRCLHVGYESSNPAILKNCKKGIYADEMKRFTENAHKARIQIHGDFQLGLPGETVQTIRETIEFAKSLNIEACQFSVVIPYKYTPLYDYLEENNYLREDGRVEYPNLSHEDLVRWRAKATKVYHLRWDYIKMALKQLKDPNELKRLFTVAYHLSPYILGLKRVKD